MGRRSTTDSAFGQAVTNAMAERNLSQTDLATTTGSSPAYISMVLSGKRTASPEWVDLVATTLNLTDPARRYLHRAAAKDKGYDIDLGSY